MVKLSAEAHPSFLYANLFSSPHALPHPLTPTITLLPLEPVVILLLVAFLLTCLFFQFFSLMIPSLFRLFSSRLKMQWERRLPAVSLLT